MDTPDTQVRGDTNQRRRVVRGRVGQRGAALFCVILILKMVCADRRRVGSRSGVGCGSRRKQGVDEVKVFTVPTFVGVGVLPNGAVKQVLVHGIINALKPVWAVLCAVCDAKFTQEHRGRALFLKSPKLCKRWFWGDAQAAMFREQNRWIINMWCV